MKANLSFSRLLLCCFCLLCPAIANISAQETATAAPISTDTALARQLLKSSLTLGESSWQQAEQATEIYLHTLGANSLEYTNCLMPKVFLLNAWGRFDQAIALTQEVLEIRLELFGENHAEVANVLSTLGRLYRRKGDFDLAMTYLKKALAVQVQLLGDTHLSVASTQSNIAIILSQKGDFDLAISWYLKALPVAWSHRESQAGRETVFSCYNGLGICYKNKEEHEKAIGYYEQTLAFLEATPGNNHNFVSICHSNLALNYKRLRQFDKALEHHFKQINWYVEIGAGKSYPLINAWLNLADTYRTMRDFENALKYCQKSLDLALEIRGEKTEDAAYVLQSMGLICQDKGTFELAIGYYDRGLSALGYAGENDLPNISNHPLLQEFLFSKNHSYLAWYRQTGSAEHLYAAIRSAKEALALTEFRRNRLRFGEAGALVASAAHSVYEASIFTALRQSEYERNPALREDALRYAEQSKGLALYQSMQENEALAYAGIPAELQAQEQQLKTDITLFEKKRQEQLGKGVPETDSAVLRLSGRIFDLNQTCDALLQSLEQDYPAYYRLKYDLETIPLRQIQKELLGARQTLLEYFSGDSSIFLFALRSDRYEVFEIKKDFPLEDWVSRLRLAMTENRLRGAPEYCDLAYKLYEKLVLPASDLLTEDLVIIPDGVLGYLPFEALLTAAPAKPTRFKEHPYLLRQHRIRYCYSATLLREMQQKKHLRTPSQPFAAFAPYFDGDTTLLASLFADDMTMRKDLQPLKSSGEEAAAAAKLMGGVAFFGKDATEQAFTQSAGDYRILHLATHGKANDRAGDYSYLAFSEIKDGEENELLYVRELYNLQLNADLVVLSACETGIGKLRQGEGIMSLARAFTYAGAKGIVTSLWAVNDVKTKELMVLFYKNLKKGMGKAEALRQAKLSFLEQNNSEGSLPYFWAGFVGIGDL